MKQILLFEIDCLYGLYLCVQKSYPRVLIYFVKF